MCSCFYLQGNFGEYLDEKKTWEEFQKGENMTKYTE